MKHFLSRLCLTSRGSSAAYIVAVGGPAVYGIATARLLGPTDRGYLVGALSGVSLVAIVGTLGTATALRNSVTTDIPIRIRRHVIMSGGVGGVLGTALGVALYAIAHYPSPLIAIPLIALICALSTVVVILREVLTALGRMPITYFLAGASVLVQIPILWMLAATEPSFITALLLFAVFTLVYTLALSWLITTSRPPEQVRAETRLNFRARSSLVALIAGQYLNGGDRVVAAFVIAAPAVAMYSVGSSIALIPLVILGASYQDAHNRSATGSSILTRALKRQVVLVIAICGALLVFMPNIISTVFGDEYLDGTDAGRISILAVPFLIVLSLANAVLLGKGAYTKASTSAGTALVVGTALLLILGSGESVGAALAHLGATVTAAGMSLLLLFTKKRSASA